MKSKCDTCGLEFDIHDLAYWDYEGFYCEVEELGDTVYNECFCDACMDKDIKEYHGVK